MVPKTVPERSLSLVRICGTQPEHVCPQQEVRFALASVTCCLVFCFTLSQNTYATRPRLAVFARPQTCSGFRFLTENAQAFLSGTTKAKNALRRFLLLCPQQESNLHQELRSLLLYPLSYGGSSTVATLATWVNEVIG